MPKVLESPGIQNQPKKNGIDKEAVPKVKVMAKKPTRVGKSAAITQNTVTAGDQDVTRLYPAGKRLLKPERKLSMAHAPRPGKEVL